MTSDAVLVISTALDAATDAVLHKLGGRGVPCIRLDTEQFPFDSQLSLAVGGDPGAPHLSYGSCGSAMESVKSPRSIWYRRVRTPTRPDEMDQGVYEFCMRESRALLVGACMSIADKIMSNPASVWQAEFKPFQLSVASAAGFCVPETVVTNSPDRIRAFHDEGRRALIVKPVRSGYFESGGEPRVIYTNRFLDEHLSSLDSARLAPSIYQVFVPKSLDIRVTYVGGRCFSAAIHSQTDVAAAVDWRRTDDEHLPHSRHELPHALEKIIHGYMSTLGLNFGALDFALTSEGIYHFLEVNPNGQWLWLDHQLDLGITDAVADWLSG